jgi:hypothetical protein
MNRMVILKRQLLLIFALVLSPAAAMAACPNDSTGHPVPACVKVTIGTSGAALGMLDANKTDSGDNITGLVRIRNQSVR